MEFDRFGYCVHGLQLYIRTIIHNVFFFNLFGRGLQEKKVIEHHKKQICVTDLQYTVEHDIANHLQETFISFLFHPSKFNKLSIIKLTSSSDTSPQKKNFILGNLVNEKMEDTT